MINLIICEDEKKYNKKIEKIVDSFMMNNKYQYQKHIFYDYDEKFQKLTHEKIGFKIYLLDIETPSASGIDIARKIRKHDIESMIIFITGHEELGDVVLKNNTMFLSFINKFDDCENRLNEALEDALSFIDEKPIVRFTDRGATFTILINDILYVTRDSLERKSIIKTSYTEYVVSKSLKDIEKMLNSNFVYSHRACLVNKSRITMYDKINKKITFDEGTKVDLVSTRLCKNLLV